MIARVKFSLRNRLLASANFPVTTISIFSPLIDVAHTTRVLQTQPYSRTTEVCIHMQLGKANITSGQSTEYLFAVRRTKLSILIPLSSTVESVKNHGEINSNLAYKEILCILSNYLISNNSRNSVNKVWY